MEEWIQKMRCLGPHYRNRPSKELQSTISRSFSANLETLSAGEVEPVAGFVDFITNLRLDAGFPLSEVQKAFDLYRIILLPMVLSSFRSRNAIAVLEAVNRCVSYQIHRFSDRFQNLEQERVAYVGQLAASLSHEIRNPLSAIKMNMQVLARKLHLEGFDRRRLEIAVDEVTRLETIIRQLRDLSRPVTPVLAEVNLNEVARGCVDLLDPKLAESGVRVRKWLDPSEPVVKADKGMVEQVLINLLLNAMDAAGSGGHITVHTITECREEGKVHCLSVRDNGPGLAREAMEKLFTPFFTLKRHGTGLGLTNVKRIVDAHKGEVLVQSRPGRGAKFTVQLPGEE